MTEFRNIIVCVSLFFLLFIQPLIAEDEDGFLSVSGPCNLEFPRDHGAHPGYRTEWWYYTGNLHSDSGNHYGFQLTFFRSQISPPDSQNDWPQPASRWRTQQIYLAHAAVADITAKRHFQAEMVSRQALGLAGASIRKGAFVVHLNNWSAQIDPTTHLLSVITDKFSFDLSLTPEKPPVVHGQSGYSLKGSTPNRASCYYSFTRLAGEGELSVFGEKVRVTGSAWMDHEYSTALLEPGLKGWDWFSLQLSDQSEIMVFLLRTDDGRVHPASSGTVVDAFGRTQHLNANDFELIISDTWKSRRSNARYPARWRLQVASFAIDLVIVSNLPDQEMRTFNTTGVTYWEGSVAIYGSKNGRPVEGQGYVELTGYAEAFDAPL